MDVWHGLLFELYSGTVLPRQVVIDVHDADAVEHCRESIQAYMAGISYHGGEKKTPLMDVIHGKALHIESDQGEAATGFDRMYVGASVERRKLPG